MGFDSECEEHGKNQQQPCEGDEDPFAHLSRSPGSGDSSRASSFLMPRYLSWTQLHSLRSMREGMLTAVKRSATLNKLKHWSA